MRKYYTDCFVMRDGKILLGQRKKAGLGFGKWDGFGGKVDGVESWEDGAKRELREECGLEWVSGQEVGSFVVVMEGQEAEMESRIYLVNEVHGEPVESEEMRPQWFALDQIPYHEMWEDMRAWLPLILEGKKLHGRFAYDAAQKMTSCEVQEIKRETMEVGEYQHYRGNRYQVLGVGTHSETLEPFVIYRALYGEGITYLRPYSMFIESVMIDGKSIPRFKKVG